MRVLPRHRLVTALAVAAVAVPLLVPALRPAAPGRAAGPAQAAPVPGAVRQDAPGPAARQAAVRYWTATRMAAALRAAGYARPLVRARALKRQPLSAAGPAAFWLTGDTAGSGLRWTHGGVVSAAVGKVFFTLGGTSYVCSGTLVGAGRPAVVLTAGHCVSGGPRAPAGARWATDWLFVPGYQDGQAPYGEYTATRFLVAPGWTGPQGGREQYDVAFVRVTPAAGRAAPAPPALGLAFAGRQGAAGPGRAYQFGYPAQPPYSGNYANFCAGTDAAAGGSVRAPCAMTAGDSGGPWLAGFSPGSGLGTVFAVSTYKLSTDMRVLYGAVLGPQARALYRQAVAGR